jgi:hypothetical protein
MAIGKVLPFRKYHQDLIISNQNAIISNQALINANSENKQQLITDATGNFTLTDAHFRTTFFINTTAAINITIPTAILRAGWVCFFHVIGTGQLNVLVDGLGVTLNAVDGTLLSQGNKGMLEKQLTTDTIHASGAWEV